MSKEYIKAQTPLPAYFPYPKFLLQMSLSHTARLTYVLLLDRMTLSQKNGWVDVQGRAYVLYPLAGLAEDLQSSISSVTRALRELEAARLIERRSNGFSKPNQIFLGVPRTAQKCAIEMAQNEQPDCSKVSNYRQPLPQQETTDRYHEPDPDGVEKTAGYRSRPYL